MIKDEDEDFDRSVRARDAARRAFIVAETDQ